MQSRVVRPLLAIALALLPVSPPPAAETSPVSPVKGMAASHRPGPGRLPEEIAPTSYDLKLTVDPREPRFQGEVTINLEIKSPTYTVYFHSQDLSIGLVTAISGGRTLKGVVSEAAGAGAEPDHGEKMASFPETLPAGSASVRFVFDGPFNEKLTGLYRAKDESGRWYAFTQFETADARRAFPCMDEPRFKTPFRIELRIPEGMTAVGNTREASRETRDGWTRIVFRETKPITTYLIAFLAGDLDIVEGPKTSTLLRGVAAHGKGSMLAESLQLHAEILPVLEEYFGRPYPFDKLDAAALVEFSAGAMENAGLITYREEFLLVDPATTSTGTRRTLAAIIAHEMAHQWFGDLVTMPWWDDIWLNEAFATWMEARAVDTWRPEYRERESLLAERERAFEQDALADARAVRQPVRGLVDAESAFDALTYTKGANIIAMMEQWLGPESFRKGIRLFLEEHAYGSATAEDLFASLSKVSGKDVRRLAHTFLDRPGVPLISAELACPEGVKPMVELTQSRYRPLGSAAPASLPGGGPWTVPVCLAYPDGPEIRTTCILLTEEKATQTLADAQGCPEWIHPDAGEYGYYRWAVPKTMAPGLGAAVKRPWLSATAAGGEDPSTRSRLALLNQTWASVATGKADIPSYLQLLEELSPGAERRVMEQVIEGIERIAGIWDDLAEKESFRSVVRRILEPEGVRLGWDAKPGESADDALVRPLILGALGRRGRTAWVLEGAAERAQKYIKDSASISPDVAGVALSLAAREGKVSIEVLNKLLGGARTPAQRTNALGAMAALPRGEPIGHALDLALTDAVRVQDISGIVFAPLYRPETRTQAFEFFMKHFDEISKRMPGSFARAARWPELIGSFCTATERDSARSFFDQKKSEGSARFLAQGVEEANQCIALRAAGQNALSSYLDAESAAQPG